MEILQIDNIRKEFGTLVAVNDVTMSVEQGHVVGLIGPNGAGKTTLLRILATLLRPTDGNATILGHDLRKDYLQIRQRMGFLPDFFNLYNDLTLQECLEFFAKVYRVELNLIPERVNAVLEFIDLEDKRNCFIRHLSRGMIQRMGVGVLLVHDPEVLLLDEPASGLDPNQRIKLRKVLKRLSTEGKTTIISSHILTELSGLCSHIAIMNKGKIILYGAVEEIQQRIAGARNIVITVLNSCDKATVLVKEFLETDSVKVQNNTLTAEMDASPQRLAELNAHLVNNNIKVVAFYEQKTDLEDIFMKISAEE
ncbi:MAG: ABC transporter ATP-binding protein [Planctomycetota bacterium]|jgi:ABC-2 type transport system ATP-binding protein